jgi:mannose-6-phosphate isomerase class I
MKYLKEPSNFDKYPSTVVEGYDFDVFDGVAKIADELNKKISEGATTIVVETYVGVDPGLLETLAKHVNVDHVMDSLSVFVDENQMETMLARYVTEDRVFGIAYTGEWFDFIDQQKLKKAQDLLANHQGVTLIFGVGASYISKGDVLVYADMTIWEIQMRYRNDKISNFNINNHNDDGIRKFKRGYFIDWRLSNRLKYHLFGDIDYYLDSVNKDKPVMITKHAFEGGLSQMLAQPFRTIPFFDEGLWGGQWMKEVCDIEDKTRINYAWSYNLLFQENEVNLSFGKTRVNIPGYTVMLRYPRELIGEKGFARFGAEYPIRFDFLDTMEGGNLSLQVHPDTHYFQSNFGLPVTQDESYYFLDVDPDDAVMYIGLKTGVKKEDVARDLKRAAAGDIQFPAEDYVNVVPVKKHDHFHIPAGTIHCAGKNTMVLEISTAPCIFTFKLWDWGRIGLDGIPRPTHIDRGLEVIRWDRQTEWVEQTCMFEPVMVDSGDGWKEEKTGLHETEYIETRRVWTSTKVTRHTHHETNALHLVSGREALIESVDGSFKPFVIHFAESVCIPATIKEYTITPYGESENQEIGVVIAFVRF